MVNEIDSIYPLRQKRPEKAEKDSGLEEEEKKEEAPEARQVIQQNLRRIMLVDDEPFNINALQGLMTF